MDWIYKDFTILTDTLSEEMTGDIRIDFSYTQVLAMRLDKDFAYSAVVQIVGVDTTDYEVVNLEVRYDYLIVDPTVRESFTVIPAIFSDAFEKLRQAYVQRITGDGLIHVLPFVQPRFEKHIEAFNEHITS